MSSITKQLTKPPQKPKLPHHPLPHITHPLPLSTHLKHLHHPHLLIQPPSQQITLKKQIFQTLHQFPHQHPIFPTNTSSLSITQLPPLTSTPHKLIPIHF
ncbi:3-hydroxyacyl-CoA dehydrogenase NAD-binding domain-containing protein, partial [Bacillus sp. WP8]|uniref:3-hydroxyacyl-CoA dehydrogenase NAD-binding domain-containing protein n=1 Tax=Bacillus sp. WP8 TaxID=756828 RepID=UPI0037BE58C7